jgi:uncharacterized protein YecT (DUF1311 family)
VRGNSCGLTQASPKRGPASLRGLRSLLTALSAVSAFTAFPLECKAAVFARDAETEVSLDPPGSPDGEGIFSFVHFSATANGQDFDFGGRMKLDGKIYRLEEAEKSNAKVEIEGDLEGEQLEVRTSGLIDEEKKSYDFSGTYRKLSDAELQRKAQERYTQADNWLNEVYGQARKKLVSFADLKKRETDWIAYRDYFAEQSSEITARSESLPKEVARLQVLRDLTMSRIRFIRTLLDDSLPAGITAVYADEYGGVLELQQDNKGVKFSLSVVRGPTSHTGDVSGRISLKGGNGIFHDPNPEEGEKPAEIRFKILDNRRIEIKARNDGYLHGARAYFDGVYFKSGPLNQSIDLE